MKKIGIGLVGCGVISDIYFQNIAKSDVMEVIACADLIQDKAKLQAEKYNISKSCTVEEILKDDNIELVLNLTNPGSHADVMIAALNAGKHVYSEKPLAVELEDGKRILDVANKKGLKVGCAPDTFLGGRLQTIRKILDDGWIGRPVAATAFMACHGHEIWHPGPEFFYKTGAGPLFDMGPYYITALVTLLGSVNRVAGYAKISFPQRTITSEPLKGEIIDVEVPTHVAGTLEFDSGLIANVMTSFDIWDSHLPNLEIYGSEGTLSIVDEDPLGGPNIFGGDVLLRHKDQSDWNGYPDAIPRNPATEWNSIPVIYEYNSNSRGVGLEDMCNSIIENRNHRASGDIAYHVLEILHGFYISSNEGKYYKVESKCERPELFELD
ncbi:MAG: Gfo/Idh/MocA family oxidoreductase [Clostridiaceae bacterium]|nr:Gfo/Idh/MocA family oxidoreductase [Clostridiaceae bacterium]